MEVGFEKVYVRRAGVWSVRVGGRERVIDGVDGVGLSAGRGMTVLVNVDSPILHPLRISAATRDTTT